jgi:hypothetical protein
MGNQLEAHAVLVSLTVRSWSASVADKGIAENAAATAGAERGSVKARKLLVPNDALKPVTTAIGALRKSLYDYTAPWSDGGLRLLPTAQWQAFNDAHGTAKQAFADAVQDFLARYPSDVAESYRRLGALFNRSQYPTVSVLASKFSTELDYSPVPTRGHIIVALGDEDNARVKDSVERATAQKFEGALLAAATEMKCHIAGLKAVLDKDGGRVHETVLVNIVRTAQLLRSLNVYGNESIDALCAASIDIMSATDADALRKNAGLRAQVAEKLGEVATGVGRVFPQALFA